MEKLNHPRVIRLFETVSLTLRRLRMDVIPGVGVWRGLGQMFVLFWWMYSMASSIALSRWRFCLGEDTVSRTENALAGRSRSRNLELHHQQLPERIKSLQMIKLCEGPLPLNTKSTVPLKSN